MGSDSNQLAFVDDVALVVDSANKIQEVSIRLWEGLRRDKIGSKCEEERGDKA